LNDGGVAAGFLINRRKAGIEGREAIMSVGFGTLRWAKRGRGN